MFLKTSTTLAENLEYVRLRLAARLSIQVFPMSGLLLHEASLIDALFASFHASCHDASVMRGAGVGVVGALVGRGS
ncbi:hypothetical protein COT48_02725 [Candidatus Woesearchaeota archaeon CG08_land_8_20_14_0_20_47_9]|nr:MAG: hypothetical protein COT48_02725 [Candidatus Woesearchaeota archaeon CG08_land_8_20_14_0_20_47_9]